MIPLPSSPKIIDKKDNQAVFEIEALYPGYGITIGNSLRRVLLSSLPGAAITEVKIKGVQHEFSTIKGVVEDVIVILQNLKQLRFKMFTDEPQWAKASVKGEREVRGSDLHLPSQLELVNKEAHIATLSDKRAEFELEVKIENGLGYQTVEEREKKGIGIGHLAVGAIFSPIKTVSYRIENMRVGERTDFDKLRLKIETDGTITPEQAFLKASEILEAHFSLFTKKFKKVEKVETVKASTKPQPKKKNVKETKIQELKIPTRIQDILLNNKIKTVAGLLSKKKKTLLGIEGLGEKALLEIEKALKELGLELKE